MRSLIEKAQKSVETARARLDAALLAGVDTAAHHRQLAEAETKLAQLASAEATPVAPFVDLGTEIEVLVRQAESAIDARLSDWSGLPPPVAAEPPRRLAAALVEARMASEACREAVAEHRAQGERIRERIAEVERQSAGITARRLAGDQRPNDAADLALLTADRDGLRKMLDAHMRQQPVGTVDLSAAERAWDAALIDLEASALREYGERVQAHLIAIAQTLVTRSKGHTGYRLRIDPRMREAALRGLW